MTKYLDPKQGETTVTKLEQVPLGSVIATVGDGFSRYNIPSRATYIVINPPPTHETYFECEVAPPKPKESKFKKLTRVKVPK